jgi:hypothetical protein
MFTFKDYLVEEFIPDLDRAYDIFSDTYIKSTGKTWCKDKFINRAHSWLFYGDEDGFVTVRPQKSGYLKLTGMAGNPRSIIKGLKDLIATNKPIWGMVSHEILPMAIKQGFISPDKNQIEKILSNIPPSVFGGVDAKINDDGSVTMNYDDVGPATKYFIANKKYMNSIKLMSKLKGIIK